MTNKQIQFVWLKSEASKMYLTDMAFIVLLYYYNQV